MCNYYLELTQKRDFGFYQYAVSYNPEIEHNKFHPRLLYDNTMILDNVRIFIEMTLYLHIILPDMESHYISKGVSDNEDIHVTIKYVTKLHGESPTSLHLYDTMFRQLLERIDIEQTVVQHNNNNVSHII